MAAEPPIDAVSSMGLRGHLHLVCGLDDRGRSSLRHQSFRAPIHISKPHLERDTLVLNVVNPTAGLMAGDGIHLMASVEPGARLLLTTPSASRAHRMREGTATVTQEIEVAAGAWLESWPELFIPQAGTRYRQQTTLRVETGGDLLFWELLAPGRVASGEVFAFERLDWDTRLVLDGQLVARERYLIEQGSRSLTALRAAFPTAYYGSCLIVTTRLTDSSECWSHIHALHQPDAWVGCSRLSTGGWAIRVLANTSVQLRRTLNAVRLELHAALGQEVPDLRRISPTR